MRIGLLSDTHGWLNPAIFKYFDNVDEIWHAGDIGSLEITDELSAFRPVRAVHGNIDNSEIRLVHPARQLFFSEGLKVLMIHIGGSPGKYPAELKGIIEHEKPRILVCGHSHMARVEFDRKSNLLYLNPGAAGRHGFHSVMTVLRFSITGEKVHSMEVIELGDRGRAF